MNIATVYTLVAQAESQTLELKKSTAEKDRACRTLCAMANGVGGQVQRCTQGRVLDAARGLRGLHGRVGAQPVSQSFIHAGLPSCPGGTKCCQHVWAVPHCHLLLEWPTVWPACACTANHDTALLENGTFPVGNTGAWAVWVVDHFSRGSFSSRCVLHAFLPF